jgi:hypothetical protein
LFELKHFALAMREMSMWNFQFPKMLQRLKILEPLLVEKLVEKLAVKMVHMILGLEAQVLHLHHILHDILKTEEFDYL